MIPKAAEIRSRVRKGAERMDSEQPGWFNRVDVKRLDTGSAIDDVVTQACGTKWTRWGQTVAKLLKKPAALWDDTPQQFGFNAYAVKDPSKSVEITGLNAAWKAEIASRLEKSSSQNRQPARRRS